jgi:hypothetical protein
MADHEFYSDVLGGEEDDDPENLMSFLNAAEVEEGVGMDDHELPPPLTSIFDHPLIEKCQVINDKGLTVPAWRCGFCPPTATGALNNTFKGVPNATKALAHLLRRPFNDIRPCSGSIPPGTMRQFERLYEDRAGVKDQRAMKKSVVADTIDDSQERVFQSVMNTGRRQQVVE